MATSIVIQVPIMMFHNDEMEIMILFNLGHDNLQQYNYVLHPSDLSKTTLKLKLC